MTWEPQAPASSSADSLATALGIIAQTGPQGLMSGGGVVTAGVVFGGAVELTGGTVVTNMSVCVQTAGAGTLPTLVRFGIIDANRVVQARTADVHADAGLQATGTVTYPLSAPWTVPASGLYYLVVIEAGAFGTTALQLGRLGTVAPGGAGLAAGKPAFGAFGTGQADLQAVGAAQPAFTNNTPLFWVALS